MKSLLISLLQVILCCFKLLQIVAGYSTFRLLQFDYYNRMRNVVLLLAVAVILVSTLSAGWFASFFR